MQNISHKPKEGKNLVTLHFQDLSTEDYCKNFLEVVFIQPISFLCKAPLCRPQLAQPYSAALKAAKRMSKMKPELYLGFSNLEVTVVLPKLMG